MASSTSAEICNNLPVDKLDSGFEAECGVTEFEDYFGVDKATTRIDKLNFQADSSTSTAKSLFQEIKDECLQQYTNNEVNTGNIKLKSFVKIVANSVLKNLLELTEYNEETINNICAWHLTLPRIFGHTAAFVVNDLHQGLLHVVLRHSDQLEEFISDIRNEIDKIKPLKQQMIKIGNVKASNKQSYYRALEEFQIYLDSLTPTLKKRVRSALFIAQIKLFEFVKNKAVSKYSYVGEEASVNIKTKVGRIRTWFKVTNSNRPTRFMVLCFSKENFESIDDFYVPGMRKRPVRTITTLWFKKECPMLPKIWE